MKNYMGMSTATLKARVNEINEILTANIFNYTFQKEASELENEKTDILFELDCR